jgi:hypothetical protein
MERGIFRGQLGSEELLIFRHVLDGSTSGQIATILELQPAYVERLIRRTCRQLQAVNRRDAGRMIAAHYGWPMPTQKARSANTTSSRVHSGSAHGQYTAKMDRSAQDLYTSLVYVRDVRTDKPERPINTDTWTEITRFIRDNKIFAPSPVTKTLLMIGALVTGSALTLSVLVSAMQGFSILITS